MADARLARACMPLSHAAAVAPGVADVRAPLVAARSLTPTKGAPKCYQHAARGRPLRPRRAACRRASSVSGTWRSLVMSALS